MAGALTLAALLMGGGVAQAQGPVLEDGRTKAVYDYTQAVRERVFIPQPGIDHDGNGKDDFVTADILRPSEGSATNKMPAIIDPSPYYTTVCRGAEGQCMADWDNDNVNDRWPLFYDNYFVPRGYAYVLSQGNGTGYTEEGCPNHGGPNDIAGHKSVVDWLNGRVKAYALTAGTNTTPDLTKEVVASWHNGSSAMIGKSYDGTLSNGVAATGVDGLKTIVPVSAISAWYNYSRTGGVRHNTNYPAGLNGNITTDDDPPDGVNLPDRQDICDPLNDGLSIDANSDNGDGDAHGDINKFWNDRDHNKDANKVKAAVFAIHGFQDDNVRMDHMGLWWEALKANNVPRKLWLLRAGHEDPFESRRAEWVTTLHRWFDHWLYGVSNGIENEPKVTIEDEMDTWGNYGEWPVPGTQNVDLYLRAVSNPASPGEFAIGSGGGPAALNFTASNQSEGNLMSNLTGSQANKRVFLSMTLSRDVRMSGTATADLLAQFGQVAGLPAGQNCSVTNVAASGGFPAQSFRNCPSLSVTLVDVGSGTQVSKQSDGVTLADTRHCWGVGAPGNACEGKAVGDACTMPEDDDDPAWRVENACYADPVKPTTNVTSWRVTRGVRDVQNRDSLVFQDAAMTPVTITDKYRLQFPTMPTEHTFKAGHRIAVIVGGINTSMASSGGGRPNNVPVALDTQMSKITLPIVGGSDALAAAGVFPSVPVGGTVPATLSLSVGPAATFAPFVPGVGQTYEASTTANVISSAGDALLSVADPSSQNTGHLVNGSFFLPQPLQARARNAANTGTAYNNVGSSASPLNLLSYDGPISNDQVSLQFSQRINANDALRTGAYTKTLTFTLSTTNP